MRVLDGERSDSGIEFMVPPCPQPPKKRCL